MLLRIKNDPAIKNLRNHSTETLEELRGLLKRGASASPDPRRKNFYELDGGSRVFYIYVSPASARITLLAVWEGGLRAQPLRANHFEMVACQPPG